MIWFSIETANAPFVVDRDTGEVTTAGVFRGLSGTTIHVQVRAFDNFGVSPTLFTVDTLAVSNMCVHRSLLWYCHVEYARDHTTSQ